MLNLKFRRRLQLEGFTTRPTFHLLMDLCKKVKIAVLRNIATYVTETLDVL